MTVKYVVSIADTLLYFDADRKPEAPFAPEAESVAKKPAVKLIPTEEHPAADPQWDQALSDYTDEQRTAAEISEVIGQGEGAGTS
jgi:hypothetical protein